MSFFSQTLPPWLFVLHNCPCHQGCSLYTSLLICKFNTKQIWPYMVRKLLDPQHPILLLQDDSEQGPRDIISSFLIEIVLALKEVSRFICLKFRLIKHGWNFFICTFHFVDYQVSSLLVNQNFVRWCACDPCFPQNLDALTFLDIAKQACYGAILLNKCGHIFYASLSLAMVFIFWGDRLVNLSF